METMITSPRNPRVTAARKLDQRKHRQEQGRFAVEGLQLLSMALDSDYQPQEVFFSTELFTGETAPNLLVQFEQAGAELVAVSPDVLRSLSDRDTPQGIFATFRLPKQDLAALAVQDTDLVIVLDRLRDPGNAGAILRTADAVGAGAVVLLTPGVDLYDPKAVRASMGSLFNLPVIQTDQAAGLFRRLTNAGLRIVGADSARGQPWTRVNWQGGLALVLGNEAQGVSEDITGHVTDWAALPVYGKADSLNVAVAGGVLMYAWAAANR